MNKAKKAKPHEIISNRGFAKYFHGRKEILRNFTVLLEDSLRNNKGTNFLFQGAPGVGKTALLEKCKEFAINKGWDVVKIKPNGLWDPSQLKKYLGSERMMKLRKLLLKGEVGGIGGHAEIEFSKKSVLDILETGKSPLLLTLDEAQTLGGNNRPPDEHLSTVTDVLDEIHNGGFQRPLILVISGLGPTRNILKSFGISRFNTKCSVDLGPLDKKPERAVINDWLVREGKARETPNVWIGSITKETHQWPHHIMSYVIPAVNELQKANGNMTSELLKKVMIAGRKDRFDYYEKRTSEFDKLDRHVIAKTFAFDDEMEGFHRKQIVSSFSNEFNASESKELFDKALLNGVISMDGDSYKISIPSMKDWLLSNYS